MSISFEGFVHNISQTLCIWLPPLTKLSSFGYFALVWIHFFSCLIFLSRTFLLYMDIMFSPCAFLFYHFSLSILWQKGRDMRVDYWFIFFIISIRYDMDWYMLACMSYIKILMILIFFFQYLSLIHLLIFFFYALLYLGYLCFSVCRLWVLGSCYIWNVSHHSLHVIGWLDLDKYSMYYVNSIWELGGMGDGVYVIFVLSQHYQKGKLLGHFYVLAILFLFILT